MNIFEIFLLFEFFKIIEFSVASGAVYVPLGEHLRLDCEVRKKIELQGFGILETKWIYLGIGHEEDLGKSPYERFRLDSDYSLFIYEIQQEDSGKYECFVQSQNRGLNMTNSTSINIIIQNCGSKEDQKQPVNPLDPCVYGTCRIEAVGKGPPRVIERLICECGEQYTGKFCDVRISGFWFYEVLMYSPIGGHFIVMGVFFFFFIIWTDGSSTEKITVIDDVPDFRSRPRLHPDLLHPDLLYPAATTSVTQDESEKNLDSFEKMMSNMFENF